MPWAESCGEKPRDMRAGFPRVHPDQNMGFPVAAAKESSKRATRRVKRGIVKRRRAWDAADSIGSKKFFRHGEKPVQVKCEYRAADFSDLGKV